MNAVTATSTTKQQLWQREAEAFRKIPGMDLLLRVSAKRFLTWKSSIRMPPLHA